MPRAAFFSGCAGSSLLCVSFLQLWWAEATLFAVLSLEQLQHVGSAVVLHTAVLRKYPKELRLSAQFSSVAQSSPTLCDPMNHSTQASLSITNTQSPPKPMSIGSMMPSNHLILCCPRSSRPQSFPASGSFPMSQLFTSGGQNIGASASSSVLPMNIQGWSPLGWTSWISLQSKGLSRVFSNTTVQKHQFFSTQLSLQSNSHIHTWLLEKLQPWLDRPLLTMFLLFMLSRLVITFLPRSRYLLIPWLQSPSAVIFGAQRNEVSHCFPIYLPWSDGTGCHDLSFLNVEL